MTRFAVPLFAAGPAGAQDAPEPESYVVTAGRTEQQVFESERAVTGVGREAIERKAARTTPEALVEEVGVTVQQTNSAGGAPILRGLVGGRILLLVDGIRLNNGTTREGPNQMLNTVDPYTVDQIEVVRGPGSVLYGSDAIGGVVNVRTLKPRLSEAGLTGRTVAHGRVASADRSMVGSVRGQAAGARGGGLLVLTGRQHDDLRGGAGEQDFTGYDERDLTAATSWLLGGNLLTATYQAVRQHDAPRTDASVPGDFRMFTDQLRDLAYLRFVGGDATQVEATASWQRQRERLDRFRLGRDRVERLDNRVHTAGLQAQVRRRLGAATELVAGADSYLDFIASEAGRRSISGDEPFSDAPQAARYVDDSRYRTFGLFAQARRDLSPRWELIGGARLNLHQVVVPEDGRLAEQFADDPAAPPVLPALDETSFGPAGSVGARFLLTPRVALVGGVMTGFRAPNVDDYSRTGSAGPGFHVPSTGLTPEHAYAGELGVRTAWDRLRASLFASYTLIDDVITRVPATVAGAGRNPDDELYLARANGERARIWALEAALRAPLVGKLSAFANAAYAHTLQRRRDEADGTIVEEALPKTPPLSGVAGLHLAAGRGSRFAELLMRWAARQDRLALDDREDARICPEVPGACRGTPGYAVLTARAGTRLGGHAHVVLAAENLTNQTYRVHGSGIDGPGRSVVASLEASY